MVSEQIKFNDGESVDSEAKKQTMEHHICRKNDLVEGNGHHQTCSTKKVLKICNTGNIAEKLDRRTFYSRL